MSDHFTAVIVDDERLARKELKSMLGEHPRITVVAEADSVAAAREAIAAHSPDIVFLDIQMPGESGFSLVDHVDAGIRIVFVTAFDAYALRAFEVNALDYLLKPINPDRLAQAVGRLTAGEAPRGGPARKLEYDDRLFLELDGRSMFLRIDRIACIRAAVDYSEVCLLDGERLLVGKSLREWEERLPEKHFARIHRSTIINLNAVERIESRYNRSHLVFLKNIATPVDLSRRHAAALRTKFG